MCVSCSCCLWQMRSRGSWRKSKLWTTKTNRRMRRSAPSCSLDSSPFRHETTTSWTSPSVDLRDLPRSVRTYPLSWSSSISFVSFILRRSLSLVGPWSVCIWKLPLGTWLCQAKGYWALALVIVCNYPTNLFTSLGAAWCSWGSNCHIGSKNGNAGGGAGGVVQDDGAAS